MLAVSVVGARPQFVKVAPMVEAMQAAGVEHAIVHTGQHYDLNMSDAFFSDLGIPAPQANLGIGSGSHGFQTSRMLAELEKVIDQMKPNWVVVYGDTNSTLAATLAAAKMHVAVAHVEAGLRSFNRSMPEEINRVLTDHASDLCLAPTSLAMSNLAAEGLADRATLVGDVMTDVLYKVRDAVAPRLGDHLARLKTPEQYYVATLHRAENTNDRARLAAIASALSDVRRPVLLAAHPRLVAAAQRFAVDLNVGNVCVIAPQSYPDLIALVLGAKGVITDSGGLQKEAYQLRCPCTTIRRETEWTETTESGWNVLAGSDSDLSDLASIVERPAPDDWGSNESPYGDGDAASRIVSAISCTPSEKASV